MKMMTTTFTADEVEAFRTELKLYGVTIDATVAREVLRKVGYREVALDALLMPHRPEWLAEIAGTDDSHSRPA